MTIKKPSSLRKYLQRIFDDHESQTKIKGRHGSPNGKIHAQVCLFINGKGGVHKGKKC